MAELTVPQLDFSTLGELPGVYRDARKQAVREQTLARLGQGGPINYADAAKNLFAAGLTQEGMSLAQLGNSEREHARAVSNDTRSQSNADRGFTLQERQLGVTAGNSARDYALRQQQFEHQKATANQAEIKTVKDASGNETLVRVDRSGRATPIDTGAPSTPGNPYAPNGKFTEVQGKAATFSDRMAASHGIISGLEGINKGAGAIGGVLANSPVPVVGGDSALFNSMSSDDRQKVMQAQRDFVNAILRRESGAAISQGEFENAKRQYFPQPGDSDAVIQQKRQNRQLAIEGNMRESGPAYRPPAGWTGQGTAPTPAPAAQKPAQQFSDGMTATNPQTGQKIMFRGGQWVPAQ